MKVSRNWLNDIIKVDETTEELANKIMHCGFEIKSISNTGVGEQNIVACEVKSVEKHQEVDNLFVTKVDIGNKELQIVTNFSRVKVSHKLLVALEGVVLRGDFKIKKEKLKGVDSEGMFIGWEELGFDYKSEAPIFLDDSVENGKKYYEIASFNDTVIELELPANRGDCLGMTGVAREISTFSKNKINELPNNYKTISSKAEDELSVEINTENCHRFCGIVIKNIKIKPSPLWMQIRLINAGIRPINNVVDITNHSLMEVNQPLHAFDIDKVADKKLIVRDAYENEKIVTLDGIERKLEKGDILITDKKNRGHSIGGIMGGQFSQVTNETKNIFLEAAFFKPQKIRRTSQRLGLRSEASYRMERTLDKENNIQALKRALYLFDKLGVGELCEGFIDVYPQKYNQKTIECNYNWINNKLGSEITQDRMVKILSDLGFKPQTKGELISVSVPAWRSDVAYKEDLAEEVARIYGYNNIQSTLYPSYQAALLNKTQIMEKKLLDVLYQAGCDEVMNFSFVGKSLFNKMELPENHSFREIIMLETALNDDCAGMRNSLIPGILKTVAYNVTRQNKNLALFEVGNISFVTNKEMPREEKSVAVVIAGKKMVKDHTADDVKYDFYDIKGIIEQIFEHFHLTARYEIASENYLQPHQQAVILLDNEKVGIIGKVHPDICDNFDIDVDCFLAEINVNAIFFKVEKLIQYSDVPNFPSSERDLAIVIDDNIKADQVFETINSLKIEILRDVKILDVFKGENIEANKYSLAIKLIFNKITSTLKDKEVDEAVELVLEGLKKNCNAKLR